MYCREDRSNTIFIEYIKYSLRFAEKYPEYNQLLQKYPSHKYFIIMKHIDKDNYEQNKNLVTLCYKDIDNLNISPKLIDIIILKEYDSLVIYCIITEKYGVSLLEKYLNNGKRNMVDLEH